MAAITVSPSTPAELAAIQPAAAEASAPLPLEESARNRNIQLALKAAGFDPGSADGKMGPRTQTAVRDFQKAQGLTPDGKVGPKTWSKLEAFLNKSASND
ncbi:MAG: peptidoglycan-binding protein [Candidatus Omnitrophica bacterium]|nr:peptidoglycan-binding protein [Candidatus Omnitrophota bacterium]